MSGTTGGDERPWEELSSRRTLIKTQDYLDVFARFKLKNNIEAVERLLTSHTELELFERSQLGMPSQVDRSVIKAEWNGLTVGREFML